MVDIHQPGDYPILLGDSLKDDALAASSHVSLRYNWIPRSGLTGNTGKIKTVPDGISLAYDRNGEALKYTGWVAERSDADQNPQLALFYDSSRSAFVVERLAATLDLNLHSGTNITPDHINRHSQIVKPGATSQNANGDNEDEDESPDESNPFDYRHFLTEAKETAEKATLAGNKTPLPGGHTPMSGLSSPMGGAHLLQSDTPQFGPVEIIDASHIEDGPEWGDRRHHFKSATKNKNARKTKAATMAMARAKPKASSTTKSTSQSKPLSSERVQSSDSDSDSDAEPAPVAPPKPKQIKKTPPKKITQPPARSPAIVVDNDSDSGGLEIQSGSPPPSLRKRGYKIDADAFRSQSGTPAITRPVSSQSNADMDVDMPDADEEAEVDADVDVDDEYNKYLASDSDEDMNSNIRRNTNADVDDLILDDGSTSSPEPAAQPAPAPARIPLPSKPAPAPAPREEPPIVHAPTAQRAKRRQSSTISRASRASRVPTRTSTLDKDRSKVRSPSPAAEDSDDDGGLAKELEEALLREEYGYGDGDEEEDGSGVGLGIEVRGGGGVDEESDISEEE